MIVIKQVKEFDATLHKMLGITARLHKYRKDLKREFELYDYKLGIEIKNVENKILKIKREIVNEIGEYEDNRSNNE